MAGRVAYRAMADVVSKLVTLTITVMAARVLSPADFGVVAVAMTTGWILSVASDAGLPLFLAKEMAQRTAADAAPRFALLSSVMRLRVAFGVSAALVGLAAAVRIAPPAAVASFAIIVVAQLLNAVVETLSHAYRGIGRSEIESSVLVGQRMVTAGAAITVLWMQPSLLWLSIALAAPPALALAVSFGIAWRLLATADDDHFARSRITWPRFAREVGPVGAGIVLSALYFRSDVFFVERWHGLDVVGTYNAAFRLIEALRLVPAALLAVAFPALCVAADARMLWRLGGALAASGIALMALTYVTAPHILGVVYGARFVEAAPALRILAIALPLFFVNYALTHQVIAWDGQRAYLAITAAALMTNLVLNALLIPSGAMVGAASATLLTELVVTAGCLTALRRTARGPALAGSIA